MSSKWSDTLIIVFYTLTVLLLGIFLIGLALEFIPLDRIFDIMEQTVDDEKTRWQFTLIGFLFSLVSVLTLRMVLERQHKERHVVYKTRDGQVHVSYHALEELIQKIGKEFLDIKKLRSRIHIRKNQVTVRASLSLYSGTQVSSIAEQLQHHIKTQFESLLGKETKVSAVIVVKHVDKRSGAQIKKTGVDHSMPLGSKRL